MGLFTIGLKKEEKALLERLVSFLETLRDNKEIVIRISLDDKKPRYAGRGISA